MNINTQKVIKVTISVLIITTLLVSLIISNDEHHIETCHEEHCFRCIIIYFAQNLINFSIGFVIATTIGVLIYLFLSRLHKKTITFVQSSLIIQKTQLNE